MGSDHWAATRPAGPPAPSGRRFVGGRGRGRRRGGSARSCGAPHAPAGPALSRGPRARRRPRQRYMSRCWPVLRVRSTRTWGFARPVRAVLASVRRRVRPSAKKTRPSESHPLQRWARPSSRTTWWISCALFVSGFIRSVRLGSDCFPPFRNGHRWALPNAAVLTARIE